MLKRCFKCKKMKPIDQFYKHRQMADGYLGKCKHCTKNDVAERYASPEGRKKVLAYEKERFQRPERKAQLRTYLRKSRAECPGKWKARNAVSNAIRDGRLIKEPCRICGDSKSQAHHPDYRRPLFVQWYCFKHHREVEHGQLVG